MGVRRPELGLLPNDESTWTLLLDGETDVRVRFGAPGQAATDVVLRATGRELVRRERRGRV